MCDLLIEVGCSPSGGVAPVDGGATPVDLGPGFDGAGAVGMARTSDPNSNGSQPPAAPTRMLRVYVADKAR